MGVYPPFVTVEVKVTDVPGHTGFTEGAIAIPATTGSRTVMVMGVELTGLFNGHVSFDDN